jgi:outer membrane protein
MRKCFLKLTRQLLVASCLFMAGGGVAAAEAQPAALTLDQCVSRALSHNHGLRAQQLELSALKETAESATGLAGPRIDLTAGYQWQNEPTGLIPAHGLTTPAIFSTRMGQYALNLRQVIYDAGKTGAVIRYQRHAYEQQEKDVHAGGIQVAGAVTKAFYRVIQLQETVKAQQDAVAALQRLYDDTRLKFEIGRVAEVELMQVESQLSAENEKLLRYQSDLERQRVNLKAMMGDDLNGSLTVAGTLADYQAPVIADRDARLNPEVQKAAVRRDQAKELLKAARADSALQISLNGQYNLKRLPADRDEMWTVAVLASMPVFDGGVTAAGIRQAKFREAKAAESYQQILNDAGAMAVSLQNNLPAAEARVGAAGIARDRAEESYRIMEISYRVGRASVTELLVAQAAMTNAQAKYYQAVFDRINLQVDLAATYGVMPYTVTTK